ncbi:MAG: hypothetical protein ABI844_01510 [Saprospiraceae bacterium]
MTSKKKKKPKDKKKAEGKSAKMPKQKAKEITIRFDELPFTRGGKVLDPRKALPPVPKGEDVEDEDPSQEMKSDN